MGRTTARALVRPSVPVLLGWRPADLASAGEVLVARASQLQQAAGELSAVGAGLPGVWSGAAAQAATGHAARRTAEVDELAVAVHAAGLVLLRVGTALGQAQRNLQAALVAAGAAGWAVSADGAVSPPAPPPVPAGLVGPALVAAQRDVQVTAAAESAVAARLTGQVQAALDAAAAADVEGQGALAGISTPAVSPAPQPVALGWTSAGGDWGPMPDHCPTTAPVAPSEPQHWWDGAGSALGDAAGWLGDAASGVVDSAANAAGNLLDLSGYALTHPQESLPLVGDAALMALGALGMAAGAGGEVGGVALDATGIGAFAGVPLNLASAGLIVGSAGVAGVGASRFGQDMNTMYAKSQADAGPTGGGAANGGGPGTYTPVNEGMSPEARAYQEHVTGAPSDQAYVVNGADGPVKFDGYRASDGTLIDAKGPSYDRLLQPDSPGGSPFPREGVVKSLLDSARRQVQAAGGNKIEWDVMEPGAVAKIQALLDEAGIRGISVVHLPAG